MKVQLISVCGITTSVLRSEIFHGTGGDERKFWSYVVQRETSTMGTRRTRATDYDGCRNRPDVVVINHRWYEHAKINYGFPFRGFHSYALHTDVISDSRPIILVTILMLTHHKACLFSAACDVTEIFFPKPHGGIETTTASSTAEGEKRPFPVSAAEQKLVSPSLNCRTICNADVVLCGKVNLQLTLYKGWKKRVTTAALYLSLSVVLGRQISPKISQTQENDKYYTTYISGTSPRIKK